MKGLARQFVPEDDRSRLPSPLEQFRAAAEELRRAREEFGMARPEDVDLACARLGMAELAFLAALRRAKEEKAAAWDGGLLLPVREGDVPGVVQAAVSGR